MKGRESEVRRFPHDQAGAALRRAAPAPFVRCYQRNVRTAGALVSPDTSRARTVIV
jgi:hypothetical protein